MASRFVISLAAAIGLLGPVLATAPASAVAAARPVPHLVGCNETSKVRPRVFNPVCDDGRGTVLRLHWSRWSLSARGRGWFYTNNCVPSCARGRVRLYDVRVTAWRVRRGDYTRFHYHFTRRVPHGLPRHWTMRYSGGMWRGVRN
jgi:hypothetical protein